MVLLHQTWRTSTVPARFAALHASWLQHNALLTVQLHDDAACRQGVADYEPALLPLYDALPAAIMRADAWRYVVLRHLGGIYADLDVEATGSVHALHSPGAHLLLEDFGARRPTVTNALMASEPGHPLWACVLALMADRCAELLHRGDWARLEPARQRGMVLWATGPYLLTDALAAYGGAGVTVHAAGSLPVVHHRAGTWWRSQSRAAEGNARGQARRAIS